jgi:IS30 family transposase
MQVSYETIYKAMYVRSKKVIEHSMMQHLRRGHTMRHDRQHSRAGDRGTIDIVNGLSIRTRSKNIDNRKSIGHWEGDLVTGSLNNHIATLVDRKTRFTFILKLNGKDATPVNTALIELFRKLPTKMKQSLT